MSDRRHSMYAPHSHTYPSAQWNSHQYSSTGATYATSYGQSLPQHPNSAAPPVMGSYGSMNGGGVSYQEEYYDSNPAYNHVGGGMASSTIPSFPQQPPYPTSPQLHHSHHAQPHSNPHPHSNSHSHSNAHSHSRSHSNSYAPSHAPPHAPSHSSQTYAISPTLPQAHPSSFHTRPRSHSQVQNPAHSYPVPQATGHPSLIASQPSSSHYPQQVPLTQAFSVSSSQYPASPSRPFSCDLCALSFNRQHDLKRHRETHTGEKPYLCNGGCGKTFTRKDALKRHQIVKTCGKVEEAWP